jgi:hypothetical protein
MNIKALTFSLSVPLFCSATTVDTAASSQLSESLVHLIAPVISSIGLESLTRGVRTQIQNLWGKIISANTTTCIIDSAIFFGNVSFLSRLAASFFSPTIARLFKQRSSYEISENTANISILATISLISGGYSFFDVVTSSLGLPLSRIIRHFFHYPAVKVYESGKFLYNKYITEEEAEPQELIPNEANNNARQQESNLFQLSQDQIDGIAIAAIQAVMANLTAKYIAGRITEYIASLPFYTVNFFIEKMSTQS